MTLVDAFILFVGIIVVGTIVGLIADEIVVRWKRDR